MRRSHHRGSPKSPIKIIKIFHTSAGDGYAIVEYEGVSYHLDCNGCDPEVMARKLRPEDFSGVAQGASLTRVMT